MHAVGQKPNSHLVKTAINGRHVTVGVFNIHIQPVLYINDDLIVLNHLSLGMKCECKDPEDCTVDSAHLCVSIMGGASEMISECEAGAWRCKGKEITILNIGDCQIF